MNTAAMIVLVCDDHHMFFNSAEQCILTELPFPVVVLANRASSIYFSELGGNIEVQLTRWGNLDNVRNDVADIASKRPIFAIGTGNEALMDLASELREKHNLIGMRPDLTARFRNKLLMKELLKEAAIRVPQHAPCDRRDLVVRLLEKYQKIVIKPIDGFGARSVTFIESFDDLKNWYESEHKSYNYEAEEYIEGTLHHVNALVRDKEILLTASALYMPGMANIDFKSGTPFVSVMLEPGRLKEQLEHFSTAVITTLELDDGITHLECFVTAEQEIVFCEIAARPGGGGIVHMIEAQYGVNYMHAAMLLQAGYGDAIKLPKATTSELFGLMGFRQPHNCKIKKIAQSSDFTDKSIFHARVFAQPGEFVASAKHCTDFFGLLIFSSASHDDFYSRRETLHQRFYEQLELEHS
jgi:ATP-grasp domain